MTAEDNNGWVKLHRRALRPDSSLMQLNMTARGTFFCYVMLAQWRDPYRGCLCDDSGQPWTRDERAAAVGLSYRTVKRAEEAMIAAGLVVIDGRGKTGHPKSQGRLRIINYNQYQDRDHDPDHPPENGGGIEQDSQQNQPSNVQVDQVPTCRSAGSNLQMCRLQPSNVQVDSSGNSTFKSEGEYPTKPRVPEHGGLGTFGNSTFKSAGDEKQEGVRSLRLNTTTTEGGSDSFPFTGDNNDGAGGGGGFDDQQQNDNGNGQAVRLLTEADVNPTTAQELAEQYGTAQIKRAVRVCGQRGLGPGAIVCALREAWPLDGPRASSGQRTSPGQWQEPSSGIGRGDALTPEQLAEMNRAPTPDEHARGLAALAQARDRLPTARSDAG